jgi:alkaline phosphatase D
MFHAGPQPGEPQNQPPTAGLQFFGHVRIDGRTGAMTVTLKDVADANLFRVTLEPGRG